MARKAGQAPPGQPPTKRARTSAPRMRTRASARSEVTWRDLHPDVMGTVSTFLEGTDIQSLLTVVGRGDHADLIKKTCLKQNFEFLEKSTKLRDKLKRQQNFRIWMKVNEWRSMYHDEKLCLSGNQYDITVPVSLDTRKLMSGLCMTIRDGLPYFMNNKFDILVSIDGQSTTNDIIATDGQCTLRKGFDGIIRTMKESTEKRSAKMPTGSRDDVLVPLRFVDSTFRRYFCNFAAAVEFGLVELCRFLVEEKGVDVNESHQQLGELEVLYGKQTFLTRALTHPDPSMLEYLLSLDGIDYSCRVLNGGGTHILHYAACEDNVESKRLKTLIEQKGVDAGVCGRFGHNALHYAAQAGSLDDNAVEKVKILLEAGVDPNSLSHSGSTPLNIARLRFMKARNKAWTVAQNEFILLLERVTREN